MKNLEKLMSKKSENKMDEKTIAAKEEVLKELIEMMQNLRAEHLGGDMESMKKVSVMAPDTESLQEGLEKAEDVVDMMPSDDHMHMMPDGEIMEDEDMKEDHKKSMKARY